MRITLFLLVIFVDLFRGSKIDPCHRIVCYVTLNGVRRAGIVAISPEKINPHYCTHIIIGYTTIVNNTLQAFNDADDEIFFNFKELKAQQPLLEILVAVEGKQQISKLVADECEREKFVSSVVEYLRTMGLDGLDLALVNPTIIPGDPNEKIKYSYLIKDLQTSFREEAERSGQQKLLLVADVSPNDGKSDLGYEIFAMSQFLDFINIMTFNYHGSWDKYPGHNSPLFATDGNCIDTTLHFWVNRGMTKGQINAAISTFGRSFRVQETDFSAPEISGPGISGPFTKTPGFLAYYELCKAFNDDGQNYINIFEKAAYYTYGDLWITYDNADTVRYKIQYLRERAFGGILIYTLDFDDITGTQCGFGIYPLTKVAKNACGTDI